MAKVVSMQPDRPKRRRWLVGISVLMGVLFVGALVFLLLNFLGIVSFSSLRASLPWSRSKEVEPELTELEFLKQEKLALEADLAQLSSRLQDKDAKISTLNSEIERLRAELDELVKEQENATAMASIYDSMDPKAAAAILARLPNEEVLSILGKLKKDQAAAILALLDSQKASEITQVWMKVE